MFVLKHAFFSLSPFIQTEPQQWEKEWQFFICIVAQAPSMHLNKITVEETHTQEEGCGYSFAGSMRWGAPDANSTLSLLPEYRTYCSIFSKNRIRSNTFLHSCTLKCVATQPNTHGSRSLWHAPGYDCLWANLDFMACHFTHIVSKLQPKADRIQFER